MYPIICEQCGLITIPKDGIIIRTNKSMKGRLCNRHYNQFMKNQTFTDDFQYSRTHPNPYEIVDDYVKFYLFDKSGFFKDYGYVSIEDIDLVQNYKWCIANTGYIYNYKLGNLHKVICDGRVVDHINRNKLDNRRENLRSVSHSDNTLNSSIRVDNTSGVIGVGWFKTCNCWRARLRIKDIEHCELFNDFEDAVRQRLLWEKELLGKYAPQRYLFEKYNI